MQWYSGDTRNLKKKGGWTLSLREQLAERVGGPAVDNAVTKVVSLIEEISNLHRVFPFLHYIFIHVPNKRTTENIDWVWRFLHILLTCCLSLHYHPLSLTSICHNQSICVSLNVLTAASNTWWALTSLLSSQARVTSNNSTGTVERTKEDVLWPALLISWPMVPTNLRYLWRTLVYWKKDITWIA